MAERRPGSSAAPAHQTFSTPVPGFFCGADRQTHLERLRDPAGWPQRVVLVTGPRGVGKSTLCRQVASSMASPVEVVRVEGARVSGAREVLNAVAEGFALRVPADAGPDQLAQLIAGHIRLLEGREQCCVMLVDDAEQLEAGALGQLLGLVTGTRLRLALFGEIRMTEGVDRAAGVRDVAWQELRLGGFPAEDVAAYLGWRFRLHGYPGPVPFSDHQIREIARLSEGLPGRIDQMANVLVARIQSSAAPSGWRRFPVPHRVAVAVLVAVVSVIYVAWRPAREVGTGTGWDDVQPVAVPPPQRHIVAAATVQSKVSAESMTAPGDAPAPGAAGTRTSVAAPAVAVAPAPAPAPAQEPGAAKSSSWIMRQPESAYTLQLATFSTAERAAAFLARQRDPSSFARFRQRHGGRIFHVVIYGSFENRPAAERAAAQLPASVGPLEPWIRTFGQVQAAARSTLQG